MRCGANHNGATVPILLEDGTPPPRSTASEMMLKGTASRVLFGDPALIVGRAWTKPPFEIECSQEETRLRITARVADPGLVNSFTDTYHADLSSDRSRRTGRDAASTCRSTFPPPATGSRTS